MEALGETCPVEIQVVCDTWRQALPEPGAKILPAIKATLSCFAGGLSHKYDTAEISILLTDDVQIRQLNARYRGQDRATNVLAFPGSEPQMLPTDAPFKPGLESGPLPRILGDIVLAYETVAAEALDQEKKFDDHVIHLVIHGLLHLLGHDHIQDEEAERMEALEVKIMAALSLADPYEGAPPADGEPT